MIPHLFYYQLVVLGLLWLCVMLHYIWPSRCAVAPPQPAAWVKSPRQRSHEPKPFAGLTHKPPCALCEQEAAHPTPQPPMRPNPMLPTNRRPRENELPRSKLRGSSFSRCGSASPASYGTPWPSLKNWRIISVQSNTSYAITI
jgi:hypothetical protein